MSQAKLSELTGISQNSISRAETGERKPRASSLRKFAEALGVNDWEMLGEEVAGAIGISDVLRGTAEKRRRLMEFDREAGRLDTTVENLEEQYAELRELFDEDPLLLARLEAAYFFGYTKGYSEGRQAAGIAEADNEG